MVTLLSRSKYLLFITYFPMTQPPLAKNQVWTLFDVTDEQIIVLEQLVMTGQASYCVFGKEICPKTKKEHLQGYTEFIKKTRVTAVRKLFLIKEQAFHMEARKGTPLEAAEYCKKDKNFKEYGVITGPGQGQGKRSDLTSAMGMVKSGMPMLEIAETIPGTWSRNHKALSLYKQLLVNKRDKHTICVVLYGASNAGKTNMIKDLYPDACWITKGVSGVWYDNYNQEEVVVYDEFKGWMPFTMFKRIVDASPLNMDAKGSHRVFNSKIVIFLSNKPPQEWWDLPDEVDKQALEKRLHFVFQAVPRTEMGAHGVTQTTDVKCIVKKMILPWGAAVPDEWNMPGLTHDESVKLLDWETWTQKCQEYADLQTKAVLRTSSDVRGVILYPLTTYPEKSFYSATRLLLTDCLGKDAVTQLPVLDLTPVNLDEEMEGETAPAAEPRSVKNTRHDMLYTKTDIPSNVSWQDLEDLKAKKRHKKEKKHDKKRAKSKYILDEAEESGAGSD